VKLTEYGVNAEWKLSYNYKYEDEIDLACLSTPVLEIKGFLDIKLMQAFVSIPKGDNKLDIVIITAVVWLMHLSEAPI
jgi:hypothetical protein